MRMWIGIDPSQLCNQHLLGEHGEIHKHRHNYVKRHSIANRIKYPAQVVPGLMKERHDALAAEMKRRGINHKSPYRMPSLAHLSLEETFPRTSKRHNMADLCFRCAECKKLILKKEK